MSLISDIRDQLLQKGLATEDTLEGVSKADIGRIEGLAEVQLPDTYKDFLLTFGRKAGKLANDVDFFYSEILGLRGELEEMIDEEGLDIEIPSKAFVFSGYQGFQYHYFICDGKEDPEVYRIMDGGEPPEKVADTFTDYLRSMIS
jgi:hypothetical protein